MTLGNLIGQRLRYLREQRGVSLRSASSDAGVSITWLCRLENGKIVEHWGILHALPEKAHPDNPNQAF